MLCRSPTTRGKQSFCVDIKDYNITVKCGPLLSDGLEKLTNTTTPANSSQTRCKSFREPFDRSFLLCRLLHNIGGK